MKIGLDIMGGDYAPKATVLGAIEAHKALSADHQLVLIGDKPTALALLEENNYKLGTTRSYGGKELLVFYLDIYSSEGKDGE